MRVNGRLVSTDATRHTAGNLAVEGKSCVGSMSGDEEPNYQTQTPSETNYRCSSSLGAGCAASRQIWGSVGRFRSIAERIVDQQFCQTVGNVRFQPIPRSGNGKLETENARVFWGVGGGTPPCLRFRTALAPTQDSEILLCILNACQWTSSINGCHSTHRREPCC